LSLRREEEQKSTGVLAFLQAIYVSFPILRQRMKDNNRMGEGIWELEA
jgi:hypothetical protein